MATRFDDIMAEYAPQAQPLPSTLPSDYVPDVKKAAVAAATEAKKTRLTTMPTPTDLYRISAARAGETGVSNPDPLAQDLRVGSAWDILNKYGEQAGNLLGQSAMADARFRQDRNSYTGTEDTARNLVGSALLGLTNTVGGIGALGAGIVNKDAGVWSAEKLQDFNNWVQSKQSAGLNNRRRANGVLTGLDYEDNARKYEDDVINDGGFVASLKRIGRDAFDAGKRTLDDDALTGDLLASAGGSLLAAGPVGKAVKLVGGLGLRGGMAAGVVGFGEKAATVVEKGREAAMPIGIGLMESGGVYQQTVAEAMDSMKDRTDLDYETKVRLANQAGLKAAAITAPVAIATGKLVSKFEAHPFSVPNLKTVGQNAIKEAIEEGIQSGTGQFAQNLGIKENVDQTKDLAAGVGEQIGLGAIGGFGSAGVIGAPGATLRTAVDAAKITGRGIMAGVGKAAGALDSRGERLAGDVEAKSPVSAAAMDNTFTAAVADAPGLQQDVVSKVQASDKLTPNQKSETEQSVNRLFDSIKFDDSEADNQLPVIADTIRGSTDQFDALKRVSAIASDEQQEPKARLAAGLYLLDKLRNNGHIVDNLRDSIEKIDDGAEIEPQLRDFEAVISNIQSHPEIRKAINSAVQVDAAIKADDVADVSTPEGQAAAKIAVQSAELNGISVGEGKNKTTFKSNISTDVNDKILFHAKELNLTPEQVGALKAANAIQNAETTHAVDTKNLGLSNSEIISREIQTKELDPNSFHQSALAHVEGVNAAVQSGNMALAKRRMEDFMHFNQSMQNKVAALNENLLAQNGSDKNATPYEAYNPRTRKFFTEKAGIFLKGNSTSSVTTAQQIHVDAKAVGYVANELAKAYPQLGVKPIELNDLHASMSQQSARLAARDYNHARINRSLDQYMAENVATSPNKSPEKVLDETKSDNAIEFEKEQIADKATRQTNVDQTTDNPAPAEPQVVEKSSPVEVAPTEELPARQDTTEKPTSQSLSRPTQDQSPELPVQPNQDGVDENQDRPEPVDIDAAFPTLLGSKTNIFKQAFKLPETAISRLRGATGGPLAIIRNALNSASKFRALVDEASGARITTDVARAYAEYLKYADPIIQTMNDNLKTALSETKQGKTTLQRLVEGTARKDGTKISPAEVQAFEEMRALAIMNEDGTYDPELQQSAVIAGLQWLLTADQRQKPLDAEAVSKILNIPVTSVSDTQLKGFKQGTYLTAAVSDLASMISRYWGVKTNNDAGQGFVRGIPEGVAKEVMRAMEAADLIKIVKLDDRGIEREAVGLKFEKNDKIYYQVKFLPENEQNQSVIDDKSLAQLNKYPAAIEVASIVEPEQTSFIGSPSTQVSDTQLRNSLVKLSPQQTDMLDNLQNTGYFPNRPYINFLGSLTEKGAVALFGHGELPDDGSMNVNHRQSLDSVNLTVRSAFKAINHTYGEAQNWAGANGADVAQTPIYYRYEITSVNRAQMVGKHNPQANKITREAFLPTVSTLDMTDQKNHDRFMLGVAQAWGVKVHTQSRKASVAEVQDLIAGTNVTGKNDKLRNYGPAIKILSDWLQKSDIKRAIEFSDEDIQTLRDTLGKGGPVPAVALHAAMELARLNQTNKENFTTSIYVEADGITDGPINSMVHMVGGEFTPEWLNIVQKGGLFIGQPGMTANEYISTVDSTDTYKHTSNALKESLVRSARELGNNEVGAQLKTMLQVFDELSPDITFNDETGDITIDRGSVKNPLTVSIYGAGASGIADKIVQSLTKAFYERETKILQFREDNPKATDEDQAWHLYGDVSSSKEEALKKFNKFKLNIATLLNTRVERDGEGLIVVNVSDGMKPNYSTYVKDGKPNRAAFTLTDEQSENLQKNVLNLFVGPMKEAIGASIGETDRGVSALRAATQVQGIYLQYAFQRWHSEELERKAKADPTFKKSNGLSQKELKAGYDKLKHLAPFIETGDQTILVSGSERVQLSNINYSRSLAGDLATPAFIYGPENPGVSGIPKVVISAGDGQMVQNIYTLPGSPEGSMPVFDGIHMKLSTMDDDAKVINEAVYRGWMANPFGDVARSFDEFVRDADLAKMDDQQRSDLSEALFGQGKKDMKPAQIIEQIKHLNSTMGEVSKEIQARKAVMDRVQMSIDHMASAEAPYEATGNRDDLSGLDDSQKLARMNEMLAEELGKLTSAPAPSENIKAEFEIAGRISGNDLLKFVRDLNVPEAQKSLMMEVARNLRGTDWQVTTDAFSGSNAMGAADFNTKTIHVPSMSSETLLHEMIHAATLDQITKYYSDPASLTQVERDAVQRIEALMNQWLNTEDQVSELNSAARDAMNSAQSTVIGHLGNGNIANAINEFMAWNLSNQDLIRVGQRTQAGKLAKIVSSVLDHLKKLFGFRGNVGQDVYSNLRFNTGILLHSARSTSAVLNDTVLFQSATFGTNDRLTKLREDFNTKIGRWINANPRPDQVFDRTHKRNSAGFFSNQIANSFMAHGFPMDMQQSSTFEMMLTAMAVDLELNPNSLQRAQELFAHTIKNITPANFRTNDDIHDNADEYQAQEKYKSITGVYLTANDELGRSSLLPAFLALAAVHDDLREVLSKLELPKTEKLPNTTLDNVLTNFGSEGMDRLSVLMSGEGLNQPSVQAAMNMLTERLSDIAYDQKNFIEQFITPAGNAVDKANDFVISRMKSSTAAFYDRMQQVSQTTNKKSVKLIAEMGKLGAGIFNDDLASANAEAIMSGANKWLSSTTLHEFLNELVGRTVKNANVYDMIKVVRSAIQSLRQQFREHLPEFLAKQFDRPVTAEEQKAMHNGMAKTDLASLYSGYSETQILDLISDPNKRAAETTMLVNSLQALPNGRLMIDKAKALAEYMNTGRAPKDLLRNAHAIERLVGTGGQVNAEINANTVKLLDHYISLLALEGLNQTDKDALSSLVQDQKDGSAFMLSFYKGQRETELADIQSNKTALFNHYKGYVPSIQEGKAYGRTMIVADDTEFLRLAELGYERVANYAGSDADPSRVRRGYYFAPVSGRSPYAQGILQTVHKTVAGIDPVTGFSTSQLLAGRIVMPDAVRRTERRLSRQTNATEHLMPIFDEDGVVRAYERSVDPDQEIRLGKSTNAMNMLGVWRGRQAEEALAGKYNEVLVDHLFDKWDKEEPTNRDEYINAFDKDVLAKDPVLADAVRLIPREIKQQIESKFGKNQFWISRDMVNDSLGYRKASIGDAWTGVTRWSPETQNQIKRLAMDVWGPPAMKYMLTAEKVYQNFITDAKVVIVVKSVIVPVANLINNMYQLASRGVPVADIIRGMPKKTAEVYSYLNSKQRLMEIEAQLRSAEATSKFVDIRKLNAEKQTIEDGHKRLSIWPLIEAGELSSVSDVGIGKEEIDFSNGRLNEYMEQLVGKLPDSVKTLGRYAIVGKDTALFKGLQRTVEYGDFLAKAILYDELVKRKGQASADALAKITEEYVNYDRLAGRTRDYAESMGLTWFWNFKIRSTKVALSMIRNNPVHALLAGFAPSPPFIGDVGNPMTDNFFQVMMDGRLDNSMGPFQGLHAHTRLNPWTNLVF